MLRTLIVLFSVCLPAWAQEAISVKDAVRLALNRNPSITASAAAKDAAQARIAQAKSGFLPKLNYAESWTDSDNPVFVFSSLLTQHQFEAQNFEIGTLNRPGFLNNFQSQVVADQPLYDAGKARRSVRSAQLAKDISGEDSRRTQLDVIASVARSYYDAVLGADRLAATQQALRSAEADLQRAESRRTAGMTTDVDVLSIRVHLATVREREIRDLADLDVARAGLNDAMGLPLDSPHSLTTSLSPMALSSESLADFEKDGAAVRPEARQSKLAASLEETQVADARANLRPQVALRGAFEADRQRFIDRGGANWLVSIGVRWNLFDGFNDRAHIQEAQAALRRSNAERDRVESAIRLQVLRAYTDVRAAQQRIETAQAAVAEAEESLRISQNRYEAGLSTVTDLLRTESALLETRTRHLVAVHDQRVAAVMLEYAAGTLSGDSEVLN